MKVLSASEHFKQRLILCAFVAIGASNQAYAGDHGWSNRNSNDWRQKATLVMKNGNVITMDDDNKVAQAIAIRNNVIVYVGSNKGVNRFISDATQVIDLQGETVLPGFIDAHVHPVGGSERLGLCSMDGAELSIAEIITRAQECLQTDTGVAGEWFKIVNVNPAHLEATKTDLDQISTSRPVLLQGIDAHTSWTNTLGLKLAGITAATPDPNGGKIYRDTNAEPTGFVTDAAQYLITAVIPPLTLAQTVEKTNQILSVMTSKGITSFQDAAASEGVLNVYEEIQKQGQLHARVRADVLPTDETALLNNTLKNPESVYTELKNLRKRFSNNPLIRADGVKIFSDGVIEYPTQTAAMIKPYKDESGADTTNYGGRYFDQAAMNKFIARLDREGYRINVHSIGDFTTHAILDAFEYARKLNGDTNNRHQISHLEIVDPADFSRFRKLKVLANMQLFWAIPNVYSIEALQPFIDPAAFRYIYPARSLQKAGATIISGSDWPIDIAPDDLMPNNPMTGIYSGVTRTNPLPPSVELHSGETLTPEEKVNRYTMIASYTINAAKGLKMENSVGSIEEGKLADLVFFAQDITKMPIRDVYDLKVDKTMFNGEVVYERQE